MYIQECKILYSISSCLYCVDAVITIAVCDLMNLVLLWFLDCALPVSLGFLPGAESREVSHFVALGTSLAKCRALASGVITPTVFAVLFNLRFTWTFLVLDIVS